MKLMNKSSIISQNISPKFIPQSLQKSTNIINQSENLLNPNIFSTLNKFNTNFLNVGLIKNRKYDKNLTNEQKFINLKKGKFKEFKSVNEKIQKNCLNSQTNENISINTSHNISNNSNQIHLLNENSRLSKKNDEYAILEKKIDCLLDNSNNQKISENITNIFEFLRVKHKNYEALLLKGKEFLVRLYEDYLNKSEKENTFKDLIEKLSCENERLQKDSHENENNLKKNKKDQKNENLLNSSSTNYTNTGKIILLKFYRNQIKMKKN